MKSNLPDFQAEVKDDSGSVLEFLLHLQNDKLAVKLTQNSKNWEKSFDLDQLAKDDKVWSFFLSQRDLYDYITLAIKEHKSSFKKTSDGDITFKFHAVNKDFSTLIIAKKVEEKKIEPPVDDKALELFQAKVLEDQKKIEDRFTAIEAKVQNLESFEPKFLDIQKNTDDKFSAIEVRLKNLEDFQVKLLEIEKSNEEKFNALNGVIEKFNKYTESFETKINGLGESIQKLSDTADGKLKDLESKLDAQNVIVQKMVPKIIDYNFTFLTGLPISGASKFSNNNRTIEKLNSGWGGSGARCDPPAKIVDNTLIFSIRIEKLGDPACYIMLGWTSKNANFAQNVLYVCPSSHSIYLADGTFYNKGSSFIAGMHGKVGQVFTTIFDLKEQTIRNLCDGKPFGVTLPNVIDYDISLLCPFVDMYSQGNEITIVENPELK